MVKLFESELKIMRELWENGDMTAAQIANILKVKTKWNRNTTYTVIKKCVEKGVVERIEPHFLCHALATKEQVQEYATNELIAQLYDGSKDMLLSALLGRGSLTAEQREKWKKIIDEDESM